MMIGSFNASEIADNQESYLASQFVRLIDWMNPWCAQPAAWIWQLKDDHTCSGNVAMKGLREWLSGA